MTTEIKNYNEEIAEVVQNRIKKMNTNISYKQAMDIIDGINSVALQPDYRDRTGVMKYLDISDREFTRLISTGTKFKPIKPLLKPTRIKGVNGKFYLVEHLDELLENDLVKQRKVRNKTMKDAKDNVKDAQNNIESA